jgi:hypothetical protein
MISLGIKSKEEQCKEYCNKCYPNHGGVNVVIVLKTK